MIYARLSEFAFLDIMQALGCFLDRDSWYRANNRLLPEYCFRSPEQLEKHLEASEGAASRIRELENKKQADKATEQLKVRKGALPSRASQGESHE